MHAAGEFNSNKWYQDILYFWAYCVRENQFPLAKSSKFQGADEAHIYWYGIPLFNPHFEHCGKLFGNLDGRALKHRNPEKCEYVLLSRSQFPKFSLWPAKQKTAFERSFFDAQTFKVRPWCLLNVMLIEWKDQRAERLAICQIREDAWSKASAEKKLIILM